MAKIFISYSQVDKKIVEELVRDLGADNHDIWFDRKLRGGQKWWDNILSQIKACEIFVAALSPEYVESRPCQSERAYANRLERILLPVLLSDKVVQNSLPQDLIGVQWVDYSRFDKQGLLDLQAALRNLPKAPRLPKLLPAAPSIPIDPREPIPKPQPPPIVPEKLEEPSRWGDSKKHVPPVKEKSTEDDTVYGLVGAFIVQCVALLIQYLNPKGSWQWISIILGGFVSLAGFSEFGKINFKSVTEVTFMILVIGAFCFGIYLTYNINLLNIYDIYDKYIYHKDPPIYPRHGAAL